MLASMSKDLVNYIVQHEREDFVEWIYAGDGEPMPGVDRDEWSAHIPDSLECMTDADVEWLALRTGGHIYASAVQCAAAMEDRKLSEQSDMRDLEGRDVYYVIDKVQSDFHKIVGCHAVFGTPDNPVGVPYRIDACMFGSRRAAEQFLAHFATLFPRQAEHLEVRCARIPYAEAADIANEKLQNLLDGARASYDELAATMRSVHDSIQTIDPSPHPDGTMLVSEVNDLLISIRQRLRGTEYD